ncbi:MAG TPA: META domain-containing protein [Bacteroidetes bacterium]|nr:META domain-containing protein [Bacteroidota bacterium]
MNICKIVVSIFIFSTLVSCRPATEQTFTSKAEDLQGQWKLTGIFQDTSIIDSEFDEKKPVITIDYTKHQIHGFSGCNSFSGGFELENDSIKILPITATQIGCMKDGESIFFKQLNRANRFQVGKDSLKMLARDTVLLSFSKER